MAGEISRKHQQFINEYIRLRCSNATEAYCRVYPNATRDSARREASRLLTIVDISEEIDRRVKEETMSADEVLMRIADEARGDMGEFWSIQADGDPVLDLVSAQERGKLHLIKKLKVKTTTRTIGDIDVTTKEVDFELYDAQAAKRMIGQHHKLFADKLDVNLTTIPEITADQRAQADKELGEWQNKRMRSAEISSGENAQ